MHCGAGAYKGDDAASSSHHEPGRVKFGTASRDAAEKIFISMEHEKTSGGRCVGLHIRLNQCFGHLSYPFSAQRGPLLPTLSIQTTCCQ